MIYVWAYEQKMRKFEAQDVLVPSLNKVNKRNRCKFLVKIKKKNVN